MTLGEFRPRHFLAMASVLSVIAGLVSLIFAPWPLAVVAISLGGMGIGFAAILTPGNPYD